MKKSESDFANTKPIKPPLFVFADRFSRLHRSSAHGFWMLNPKVLPLPPNMSFGEGRLPMPDPIGLTPKQLRDLGRRLMAFGKRIESMGGQRASTFLRRNELGHELFVAASALGNSSRGAWNTVWEDARMKAELKRERLSARAIVRRKTRQAVYKRLKKEKTASTDVLRSSPASREK
jgi:hypothetical protein